MAATYGPQIVNAKVAMEHEEEGDFGNAWLQLNAEGTGTGGWKLVSFEPGQEVILERNENYWRGWEGNHFERIIIRVVEEVATMRQLVEAGDVDIMDRFSVDYEWIDEFQQNPDAQRRSLATAPRSSTSSMTVGRPLASPEARQAMCYAYPYQEVIDGVYMGLRLAGRTAPSRRRCSASRRTVSSSRPTSTRRRSCSPRRECAKGRS